MATSGEGFRLKRALFPAGYYGANSIYQGYISLFYTNLGFSGGQLGLLHAVTAAAALAFAPLWGILGDRTRSRRLLLAILTLAAAFVFPLKLLGGTFLWQMIAAGLFYAFFCALLPLGDSLLLGDGAFGAYRLAGGVSFAVAGALYGLARPKLGQHGLWVVSALLGLTAVFALLLPDVPGQKKQGGGFSALLKNRPLMLLLFFTLPLQMTMSYFYTFYAPRFAASGGSDAMLGISYFISAASEAPYLLCSRKIYRKFGAAKPMCIAAGLLAARWLLLGLAKNPLMLLASQILHGGGFIVITVSMAYWISENVPENLRASGQSLLNMFAFGLARITGSLLGGFLAQNWGMERGFLLCAAVCALAGVGLAGALKSNYCISRRRNSMV